MKVTAFDFTDIDGQLDIRKQRIILTECGVSVLSIGARLGLSSPLITVWFVRRHSSTPPPPPPVLKFIHSWQICAIDLLHTNGFRHVWVKIQREEYNSSLCTPLCAASSHSPAPSLWWEEPGWVVAGSLEQQAECRPEGVCGPADPQLSPTGATKRCFLWILPHPVAAQREKTHTTVLSKGRTWRCLFLIIRCRVGQNVSSALSHRDRVH